MHYYQFNIADYRKDTQHLTPIEHYIYRELMDLYYLDESPIPNKTQWVIRRLRLGSENDLDVTNVLEEFFELDGEEWMHKRINQEIDVYRSKAETARVNGSKGGRPKKPRKTHPVNLANPDVTQTKANHKPLTINQYKEKDKKKAAAFNRPSVDEVNRYVLDKNYTISAQRFIDHYDSNGWKVGKNSMKDWKAAVRTWQQRESESNEKNQRPNTGHKTKSESFWDHTKARINATT